MQADILVGPQARGDGSLLPARGGKTGELITADAHGRYYEAAVRGKLFTAYAANQATSLAGTAMVGLQVWNGSPTSGGVNLVLLKTGGLLSATASACTGVVLTVGTGQTAAPSGQTAITKVTNNYIGGSNPQALATAAGTFTNAPAAIATLLHNTAAIATTGEDAGYLVDLEGSIIIPPQTYVAIATIGAAGAGWYGYLMWEEVPF